MFVFLPTGYDCEQCWWVNKESRGVMGEKKSGVKNEVWQRGGSNPGMSVLLLQVHALAAAKVPTCPPYGRRRPASHLPPLPTEPRAGALHLNLSQCPRPPPAQCPGFVSPRQAGGAVLDPSANRPTDHPLHMEACSITTHHSLSLFSS